MKRAAISEQTSITDRDSDMYGHDVTRQKQNVAFGRSVPECCGI